MTRRHDDLFRRLDDEMLGEAVRRLATLVERLRGSGGPNPTAALATASAMLERALAERQRRDVI